MDRLNRRGSLDLNEDLAFQHRMWVLERIGWGTMAVFALAGLLGVFGHGPLSETETGQAPFSLRYQHLARYQSPTSWEFTLHPSGPQREAAIWIGQSLLEGVELTSIVPAPLRAEASGDRVIYRFALGEGPTRVSFKLRGEAYGRHTGQVGLVGGPALTMTTFYWP